MLRELANATDFQLPQHQGLGAYPGEDNQFLGMLGMHGTYEANNAMHGCDLMINVEQGLMIGLLERLMNFHQNQKKFTLILIRSQIKT